MKPFLLALLTLLISHSLYAGDFLLSGDISYTLNDDSYSKERCRLDVYHPADTVGMPVVVWFHGGGLTGGSKYIPDELKDGKQIVVAVNYRLLPEVEISDCIDDAAVAVAWTFRNIGSFGGDKNKIFVSGHSAGGYLTSMIGLDRQWLKKYGVDTDSVAGLVPFSGQVITHFAHRRLNGLSELQPAVDKYAPLYHVRADSSPYIIITGGRDEELLGRYEENAYMWRMMKLCGHPYVYIYELDGHNHGEMVSPAFLILKKHMKDILEQKRQ